MANSGLVASGAVSLAFDGEDPGWDDTELIDAWDAAAKEFKLYNPGPGSWLDKALASESTSSPNGSSSRQSGTASGSQGDGFMQAVKEAEKASNLIRTRWYTSSLPEREDLEQQKGKASWSNGNAAAKKKGVNGQTVQTGSKADAPTGTQVNPYSLQRNNAAKRKRDHDDVTSLLDNSLRATNEVEEDGPQSPSYTPLSPKIHAVGTIQSTYDGAGPLRPPATASSAPQNESADEQLATDYEPTATGVYPDMGVSSGVFSRGSVGMSREEATTRAINAQWWAGYWYAMSEVLPSGR